MLTSVFVDLTLLNEEQLSAFFLIDPGAVKTERERRFAFADQGEMFSALAQAALDLEASLETMRGTAAAKAVRRSGILETARRALALAKREGLSYVEPVLHAPA